MTNEEQPSAFVQAWNKSIEREQRLLVRAEKAEAALAHVTEEREQYRIEADCGLRDYDALELKFGILETALQEIADARGNQDSGYAMKAIARVALASVADR
jgi:hypothetical protein